MEDDKVKINIKYLSNALIVEVEKTANILTLKKKIKEKTNANENDQKLIFKGCPLYFHWLLGHILKDEELLQALKPKPEDIFHLVIKKMSSG